VANHFLNDSDLEKKEGIVSICVDMQERVRLLSERYKNELRRYYYVTPTSYLELIKTFKKLLADRRKHIFGNITRYDKGLLQLEMTEKQVLEMSEQLKVLQPQLEKSNEDTAKMMIVIQKKQIEVDEATKIVEKEEADCKAKMKEAEDIENDCKRDLAKAEPILIEATAAVSKLKKDNIIELGAMQKPNPGIKAVINCPPKQ
jgi:dynein heavy chain